jgi:glycosyltransferase involved in cell wall biosynthesis
VQPDLVHAMRIPYEGMLAALANPSAPLLVSVWGNDFTLHAPSTPLMGRATRQALKRASALHSDCQRDIRLAHQWGLPAGSPSIVLPGAGGIQTDLFFPPEKGLRDLSTFSIVNPRGVRAYIRNDTFFKAIPHVLKNFPQARFLCPSMAEEPQATQQVRALGLEAHVDLLPHLTRPQMADLFRHAHVVVSPSTHDGTPNTLLEAMACGCFPVVGDLESLREWITPGQNGLLVDAGDPLALAEAVQQALKDPLLRQQAQDRNIALIAERAAYDTVMPTAAAFYASLVA